MSFSSSSTRNIKIFFAYSQNNQDERLRQALEEQLHLLNSLGVDTKWYKYQIETEPDWEDEICKDLDRADLIILLVSSTFMHELHEHWNVPVK
jgi:alcohol dehydrogenase YqhD (iron-dependent ADH family)